MRLGQDALARGDIRKLLFSFCLPSLAGSLSLTLLAASLSTAVGFLVVTQGAQKCLDLRQGVALHISPAVPAGNQAVCYSSPSSCLATASWACAKKPAFALSTRAYN